MDGCKLSYCIVLLFNSMRRIILIVGYAEITGGKLMFIETNPKDKTYRDLIDLAFDICDEFILVAINDHIC